jgi:tetraprenyl-beta-curcumene synthase
VLVALAQANARYWPRVAPTIRRELRHWRRRADAIPTPWLRSLAHCKLDREGFNAEVAGVFATLADRAYREPVVQAIVALQVMYDYLDGLTEQPTGDALRNAHRLFEAFTAAVTPGAELDDDYYRHIGGVDDGGFLVELARTAKDRLALLPAADSVAGLLRRNAVRAARAQAHIHSGTSIDEVQVTRWAAHEAQGSALGWRGVLAAATSSVIGVHALVAAAGDRSTTPADAASIDSAYLPISAVSTMLDALVDHEQDAGTGALRVSFLRYCGDLEWLSRTLPNALEEAVAGVQLTDRRAHHLMMLVGVVAYYTTDVGAKADTASASVRLMHRRLRPLIWPTLAIMRGWRLAKRLHAWRPPHAPASQQTTRAPRSRSMSRWASHRLAAGTVVMIALAFGAATLPAWAHTLNGNAEAHLRYLRSSGSTLVEEGPVSGGLSGRMHALLHVSATFSGTFVFHTADGEIRGQGTARPHGSGRYESFSGTEVITGGTGRYAHAHGHGSMYGTFDRANYDVTIQTRATLYY